MKKVKHIKLTDIIKSENHDIYIYWSAQLMPTKNAQYKMWNNKHLAFSNYRIRLLQATWNNIGTDHRHHSVRCKTFNMRKDIMVHIQDTDVYTVTVQHIYWNYEIQTSGAALWHICNYHNGIKNCMCNTMSI